MAVRAHLGGGDGRIAFVAGEDGSGFRDAVLEGGVLGGEGVAVEDDNAGLGGEAAEVALDELAGGEGIAAVDFSHGAGEGAFELWCEEAEADGDGGPGGDDGPLVRVGEASEAGKGGVIQLDNSLSMQRWMNHGGHRDF